MKIVKGVKVVAKKSVKVKTYTDAAKKYYENAKAPTPRWAKWAGNGGIVLTAIGTGLLTGGIAPGLAVLGKWLIFGGTVSKLIFQGFKKSN